MAYSTAKSQEILPDFSARCFSAMAKAHPTLCFDLVDKVFQEVGVARKNKEYRDNYSAVLGNITRWNEIYSEWSDEYAVLREDPDYSVLHLDEVTPSYSYLVLTTITMDGDYCEDFLPGQIPHMPV